MAYTPLIKKLNPQGSTFYTFSSAARDLSKCLGNSSTMEFRFSHFALINIPNIVNKRTPNKYVVEPEDGNRTDITNDDMFIWKTNFSNPFKETGFMLACMLQNYVYNFEERLISHGETTESNRSIAERVFWHWLYRTGAITWRNAAQGSECATARVRRIEGAEDSTPYNRVVQYLGNIDITNSVYINSDAYTELYIHVPAEAGDTPKVLWLNDNDGFPKSTRYECENASWILGQNDENPSYNKNAQDDDPIGLSYGAIYDYDAVEDDCYITDDTDNEGVCIDWDSESYWDIMTSPAISTMDEYNASTLANTFEFNAALIYYDIIDKNNGSRTTNLYGVMFLDDIKAINSTEYIQRYPKYKPTEGAVNGNSYGFKLNLRIDIEPNKQGITTLVNEYNTYSMGLFADAIMRIQECTNTFMHLRDEQYKLSKKYNELETIIKSFQGILALKGKVEELEQALENANIAYAESGALQDIIYNLNKRVEKLASGTMPNALALELDLIKSGYNVDVDTSDGQSARLGVKSVGWTQCPIRPINRANASNITASNPLKIGDTDSGDNRITGILKDGNNMIRVYTRFDELCSHDIEIYIDDTLSTWRNGQTVRIVFPTLPLEILNGKDILIYTDKSCKSGIATDGMGYGCKCKISEASLVGNNPIIDLVCTDETFTAGNNSVVADVIR